MEVSNIPQDMINDIRVRFESTPEVRLLRTKEEYAKRKGDYKEALRIAQMLEGLFPMVLQQYIDKAENEVVVLDSEVDDIPSKDKEEMMETLVVLFMSCDIIDTAVRDLNDILHRSKKDIDITAFNDIKQLSDMAKQKIKYLQENGDYMNDLIWVDKCDNMYEMMRSKARSIIRKRKESANWGDNMKS